ncbi:hypothetical protein L917_20031, partial [Phytophthora nicotianae]
MARMERVTLHHIDRQANSHADRFANAALDRRRTKTECGVHPNGDGCTCTVATDTPATVTTRTPSTTLQPPGAVDVEMSRPTDDADDDGPLGDIDDGEAYAPMRVGPDAVPQRRPRLRLRKLSEDELDQAAEVVERLGAKLAAKIADASDWESAEGYITALPHLLYDKLQPYSQAQRRPEPPHHQHRQHQQHQQRQQQRQDRQQDGQQRVDGPAYQQDGRRHRRRGGRSSAAKRRRRQRPPRVTRHHREHRLDEALDDLHAVVSAAPGDRTAVSRARRRVGRVSAAIDQQRLRHRFDTAEKAC